ncbi:zwei Ig domain protein zig-8 isoform X2 [Patella vulgata]|uniref:zwei Ig domain protein zig-8 isoform X2 n=1 Tax=Patella vulgata TaxID=6465 RepID=UPI0024A9FE34|nr:zwei Ig domain protein zig-8 isoform X2 [Patella vulgata]
MLFLDVKCWDIKHYQIEILLVFQVIFISVVAAYVREEHQSFSMPYFLNRPNNVTFHRGDTAVLRCAIENIGTKTVIWRRTSDPNPITIGELQFISDPRIALQKLPERKEFNLLIKDVQPKDGGVYECQVSARKKLTKLILLRVNSKPLPAAPSIFVSGTQFVEKGDSIHLVCNSSGIDNPPDNLDWFKDGIKISPDAHQKITLEKYKFTATKTLVSVLVLKHSQMADAGTYVCRSSNLDTTSVKVHILNAGSPNVKRGTSTVEEMTGTTVKLKLSLCVLLVTLVLDVLLLYQFTGDIL